MPRLGRMFADRNRYTYCTYFNGVQSLGLLKHAGYVIDSDAMVPRGRDKTW